MRGSPTSSSCSSIPTALVDDGFLLSEALRGEGALLLDDDGARFTDELAPRDVVARAIAARGQAGLDLRPIDRSRFPGLIATLERAGYDPAREPIPVSPAAHYTVGGIVTDLDGRTTVAGLYAAGECACTGVHGANRLASNSLLECLVFGRRAALAGLAEPAPAAAVATRRAARRAASCTGDPARAVARRRPDAERRGARDPAGLGQPARPTRRGERPARTESRGVHFRSDFPTEDAAFDCVHVTLEQGAGPRLETWN